MTAACERSMPGAVADVPGHGALGPAGLVTG
jgi:hypothetical protein